MSPEHRDIAAVITFIGYAIPVVVAFERRHPQTPAIAVLCVIGCLLSIAATYTAIPSADWTSWAWIGALVWACTNKVRA